MPQISEYTTQLVVPQYTPQSYDIGLEVAVAQKKQENYNKTLNLVRGLQSQALNIQMLNQEGRERLDQYNRELNEQLSGDLGDLTKIEVQNEIADYFQRIAGDTQLVKASQLSSQYQNQLDIIESFRQSGRKDKGYNSINETVFKEWDGGLYDFAQSSLNKVTDTNFRPAKYTPFKELDTKLLNIVKTLRPDTVIREGAGSEGYLLHQELTEVSPEKIREMMLTQFDQEDLEQLEVMAKYEVLKNRGDLSQFYTKYNSFSENEIKRVENKSEQLKQQAEYYQTLINKADTPADKKAEYLEFVNQFNTNAKLYDDRATTLRQNQKSYDDFTKMSNEELLEYSKEMQWHNKINGVSSALSWKKDVQTLKPDQVWMFNKKMDVMMWQENLRAQTRMNIARMQREGKDKTEAPQFSGPIDSVRNTQSFFDSYKTLVNTQEGLAQQTNRVISNVPPERYSVLSKDLMDDNFLERNKGNYEIKMWDVFRREQPNLAVKNGQPQIEAFKLWLADKESNPDLYTSQLVETQTRNEIVSDYLDIKVAKINELTREKTNEFDLLQGYPMYKADGTPLSREDYNKGVPAYLGVPTNKDKTNFRLVKLDDALEEVKKGKKFSRQVQQEQNRIVGSTSPSLSMLSSVSNIIDTEGEDAEYKGYLQVDLGLVNVLDNINKTKQEVNTQLEQQLVSELPQIFQMPLVEAVNDEAKLIYMNDVVSAAKNSNEGAGQFAISTKDIAFMRPPTTGDIGQFGLTREAAETYGESGWMLPDAAQPDKLIPITPGGSYAFRTNRPYMPYDVLLNEAAKEIPIKDKYKGYTTTISKSKLDNSVTVSIADKNGNVIGTVTNAQVQDVNAAIQAARRQIDVEINYNKK